MPERRQRPWLEVAAGFLLAVLLGTGVACSAPGARRPGRIRPAPRPERPRDGPFVPRAPVARGPVAPADPDRDASPDDFSVTGACLDCHYPRQQSLAASFHGPLLEGALQSVGCEECHGPGLRHVGDGDESEIRHPDKAPREASNAVCLRCHSAVVDAPVRGHPKWIADRRVACATCHTVHEPKGDRVANHGLRPAPTEEALRAAGAVDVPPGRCLSCHPDYHPGMERSGHADLRSEGRACATCHGPGSLHADAGGLRRLILLPTEQPAREADRACLSCHDAGGEHLPRWTCSEHRAEGISCATCHAPNEPRGHTLRKEDPALCLDCHKDVGAEFRLPSRHRVLEGAMRCADCHDPHGNEAGFHRFELSRDACARCHPEKSGPFVFDHTAKRLEGCVVCHRPHGSVNARLLETRDVRSMCLSCHPDLPRSHEQKPGSVYRNCLRCHVEIHGSDADRTFFR